MRLAGIEVLALLVWCCAAPGDPRIYRYEDDEGRVAFVSDPSRVPAKYRARAVRVDAAANEGGEAAEPSADAGPASEDEGAERAVIYQYPGPSGRPAFTNRRDLVPTVEQQRVVVVDLSRISTNSALGNDIDDAVDRELERLADSAPCRDARAEAGEDGWTVLWRDQRHLVVVGAMLALFLLVTPWAFRRLGAPWIRVLTFAIPTLLLTGLVTHVAIEVNRSMSSSTELRALCDPKDPATPKAPAGSPAHRQERVEHADSLRVAIEGALSHQDAAIQSELAH